MPETTKYDSPFALLRRLFAWPEANEEHRRREWFDRLSHVERNSGLPVKASAILLLIGYLFSPDWEEMDRRGVMLENVRTLFVFYILINLGAGVMLIGMRQLPLAALLLLVLGVATFDVLFLGAMTMLTGGFDSLLYWMFVLLIVRNSLSITGGFLQISLNLFAIFVFWAAGEMELQIDRLDKPEAILPGEPYYLKIVILGLMTACCYGVQSLFERQRKAKDELREHAIRQEQLQAAGRLAAEIAHQLKNPLSIINNAAYNLQTTKRRGKTITQQIQIIREEVDRSDRIITNLMGFAQLKEGKIEPLNIPEYLDRSIDRVFPKAAAFSITVHRDYQLALPLIFMQRGHLSEIFVNVLQNAREALEPGGTIHIGAHYGDNYSVVATIEDDGPGMEEDQLRQLFEAYYTTKQHGTGLGLAIVKHNVELYGGTVTVESELGRGTRFRLIFPARTLMKLRR